jgi:hypothetical protein
VLIKMLGNLSTGCQVVHADLLLALTSAYRSWTAVDPVVTARGKHERCADGDLVALR